MKEMVCKICRRGCLSGSESKQACLESPKLNLGSGDMLKAEYINYDRTEFRRGDLVTDVLGRIETVTEQLPRGVFAGILCAHVVEHFRPRAARKLVEDCFALLRPKGLLILEGPDVLGIFKTYSDDIPRLVQNLYGDQNHIDKWGEEWSHRWGYTKDTAAELLAAAGFEVTQKGIGLTHGMGPRDFRVEGRKN